MSVVRPAPEWAAALRARRDRPPLKPRVPLWFGSARVGSVEPELLARMPAVARTVRDGVAGWEIRGDLTASLHELALAMREAGAAHAWRDEQLAVRDDTGAMLGTVERAVVRPLGIATHAVHLAGFARDGRHWVQQRSLTKANDPGLWDTLMGGMVPACDTLQQSLERETWEEAGLSLAQLESLEYGGRIATRGPSDIPGGYVIESIDWYRCVVPHGTEPVNQDGEVAQFRLMESSEVASRLERDEFTLEAASILLEAGI